MLTAQNWTGSVWMLWCCGDEINSRSQAFYLSLVSPVRVSILRAVEVLHQHGRKDAHAAVELALPEAVVLLVVLVEDADDGPFGEGQLVVRLRLVVVDGLHKTH